ncbi:hypothetical protein GCK32_012032, partial [Trichostrongylus colubriformis]
VQMRTSRRTRVSRALSFDLDIVVFGEWCAQHQGCQQTPFCAMST